MDPPSRNDGEEGPEAEAEAKISKCFHLYNCDTTYKFDSVKKLLESIKEKLNFDISIAQHYFHLREMSETCKRINSESQMDFAIFVVHAHESRLSINEDNAGIGYAKIYRALLQKTGGKVIIVIGGDDNYKNSTEEQTAVLSRWAYRKVSSQFDEQFLDGRKSFIFSWDKEHRPVHEEAMLHFFDPSKKGKKFVPEPKVEPTVPEVDPQKGTESHESSKINADETSNVIKENQKSEGQEPETSSEQKVDYQRDPKQMDETAADNTESVGYRPIHEEAMLNFFDPVKKGKKFVPEPKVVPKIPEVDPQKGVSESHESSKTNADKTSNVLEETQTSEGQEPETSSEQNETGPESFEFVGLPQKQQETEEHMDTSDDAVVLTHDDVPKDDPAQSCPSCEQPSAPTDAQVSLMHANTVILYRDQPDIAYMKCLFGDVPLDTVTIKAPSYLKEFFSSNSVGSCFMFVEAKTMQEELQKRSHTAPYEDLLRTVREKVEEKVVIFLCYNKFSQIEVDAITVRIKELLVNKKVQILCKQNAEDLTLLLKTRLRHGKISYDEKYVEKRVEGWTAPQKIADELLARWQSTINAELRISQNTKTGDHHVVVKEDENHTVKTVKEEDNLAYSCPSREPHSAPTDAQVSLMHENTVILYRDQSDIAFMKDLFGDELLDKAAVTTVENPSDLKKFFSGLNSVGSCFAFVEAQAVHEELQKRSHSTLNEDLLRTVKEKVEEKVVIFLCDNKFSQIEADAITVRIKKLLVDKKVQILCKQNAEDPTLLLKTRLRHGKISYNEKDVEERLKGWTAPQKMADELLARWQSTINAELHISQNTKTRDHHIVVKEDENNAVNTVKETWHSFTSSLPSRPRLSTLFGSGNTSSPKDGPDQ